MQSNTLMVIAHPGHEILAWGWLRKVKPRVLVVTDGSGGSGESRIVTTGKLLRDAGTTPGKLFGDYSDRFLYSKILERDVYFLEMLVHLMVGEIVSQEIRVVVGDSAEGMIMSHDLIREVRRVAVRIAEDQLGWKIKHLEFPLDSHPNACPINLKSQRYQERLDQKQWDEKIRVAKDYPDIRVFVDAAIEKHGVEAFQQETFFPVTSQSLIPHDVTPLPYEAYGDRQVKAKRYQEAIHFHQHLSPIFQHLYQLQPDWSDLRMPMVANQLPMVPNQRAVQRFNTPTFSRESGS